jgi:cytochrome c-type biogenesis protein CcmE
VLVPVVYHGSVPDLFKVGRHIVLTGKLHGATFVGDSGSLVTKCPSKYAPAKSSSNS